MYVCLICNKCVNIYNCKVYINLFLNVQRNIVFQQIRIIITP